MFLINIIKIQLRHLKKKNKTPLHYAAISNSKEIAELLISKGADFDAKDIIFQNVEIVTLLLIRIINEK